MSDEKVTDPKQLVSELKEALSRIKNPVLRDRFAAIARQLAPKGGPVNTVQIRNLIKVLKGHNR